MLSNYEHDLTFPISAVYSSVGSETMEKSRFQAYSLTEAQYRAVLLPENEYDL